MTDRRQRRDRRRSDRRDDDRAAASRSVRLLRGGPGGFSTLPARIVDATPSGIRLTVEAEVAVGDALLVETDGDGERLNLTAHVAWLRPQSSTEWLVGCELRTPLTPVQLQRLAPPTATAAS